MGRSRCRRGRIRTSGLRQRSVQSSWAAVPVGSFLPGQKRLAAEHGVAVGTAHRAVVLLADEGLVRPVSGQGFEVVRLPEPAVLPIAPEARALEDPEPDVPLLDFVVRRGPEEIARFSAAADPNDPRELRGVLLDAIRRHGHNEEELATFELDVFVAGDGTLLRTFVASAVGSSGRLKSTQVGSARLPMPTRRSARS